MATLKGVDNFGYHRDEDEEYKLHRTQAYADLTERNPNWDRFEKKKTKIISWSSRNAKFKTTDIVCKLLTIIIFFVAVLFLIVISKLSILSLTSRLGPTLYDQKSNDTRSGDVASIDVRWVWAIVMCILTPTILTLFLGAWKICTKKKESCGCLPVISCLITECLHSIGLLLLAFLVLPNLKPIPGCLLMSTIGIVPAILRVVVEWDIHCKRFLCNVLNVIVAVAYIAVLGTWCYVYYDTSSTLVAACLPFSVVLVSIKWWDNYAESFLRKCNENDDQEGDINLKREKHNGCRDIVVSVFKITVTLIGTIIIYGYGENGKCVRTLFYLENISNGCSVFFSLQLTSGDNSLDESCLNNLPYVITSFAIGSGLICYMISVASCKARIQAQCFSLPIMLSMPATFGSLLLIYHYGSTTFSMCVFKDVMVSSDAKGAVSGVHTPIWICSILGWILFCLVSGHIWVPSEDTMTKRLRLFSKPMYCNILLGESLALSRRRLPEADEKIPKNLNVPIFSIRPRVIVCATMWHETEQEMSQVLKSIYRLDADSFTRRVLEKDSYDLEVNILLDDAFDESKDVQIRQINSWSKQLIRVVREIYLCLSEKNPCVGEPSKPVCYETPYGGRVVWKLPGGTTMTAHLKDKTKIRHKKRWSQVMYMYYFLGLRMRANTEHDRKKNDLTFLLALDGDVDFEEVALKKLIDRMLRDPNVGAACGRIHPVGTGIGPILWYQKFEYAVSHWLQKATEHVTGCVLCSPGCFSLYRASALMDKDVIRKYATPSTESRHFVQYDQGEDRWLCTLLLQRGHRIEYCAASDSYTFAPEGFGEFFNQRKRWSPSTISNTMDLLMNWSHLTKRNNTISSLFLVYETALMLCLLFTPGTIFLLILGATNLAFPEIPVYGALVLNMIPVGVFIAVCLYTNTKTQVKVAGVLCIVYILSMMVVLVGLILQAARHGICSATSLFLISVIGIFFTTALLHPREFSCIFSGLIYFFFTPTMSMLLVIYSLCNLNNISWGTREKKAAVDHGASGNSAQEGKLQHFWSRMTALCRCFCFAPEEENNKILGKLDKLEKMVEQSNSQGTATVPSVSEEPCIVHWTEANCFRGKNELDVEEETFWRDLLEKYLRPQCKAETSEEDIKNDLKELRNRVCLLFLVANSLMIILVLILQMNPGLDIHLPCASLQFNSDGFEPISVTFMVVFGLLLFIQFFGMLFHRFATFLHILSTTEIPNPFNLTKKKVTKKQPVMEDEPDGAKETEEDDDALDGETEVRIFKYLLLHDVIRGMKRGANSVDSGSEYESSDDEETPRFESISLKMWKKLSKAAAGGIRDSKRRTAISNIAGKTKITERCLEKFLEKVKNNKEKCPSDSTQTKSYTARRQPNVSGQAGTSVFQFEGPSYRGEVRGWDKSELNLEDTSTKTRDTNVKHGNKNQAVRPHLKNKVSPRSEVRISHSQTVAVVHKLYSHPEVNIDDLTNETNL